MKKFLFNTNIFDDDDGIPPPDDHDTAPDNKDVMHKDEEIPPLPPMFTKDELDAVRRKSFEKGRQDAIAQTTLEREEHRAKMLDTIAAQIKDIAHSHGGQTDALHNDALRLALAMFEHSMPILTQEFGADDLKTRITDILSASDIDNPIKIAVHPDMIDTFGTYIAELKQRSAQAQIELIGDETLSAYACAVTWENGGGYASIDDTAQKVADSIREALAGAPVNRHDNDIDDKKETDT